MEHLDPQMTQRVWQRVQGMPQEDTLPMMLGLTWSCAACCGRLSKHFRGQETELLRARTELLHQAACLQGIRFLRTGQRSGDHTPSPSQEPPEAVLRKCLGHCLRLTEALQKEAGDPEYGPVFAAMAQRMLPHAQLLLALIGK